MYVCVCLLCMDCSWNLVLFGPARVRRIVAITWHTALEKVLLRSFLLSVITINKPFPILKIQSFLTLFYSLKCHCFCMQRKWNLFARTIWFWKNVFSDTFVHFLVLVFCFSVVTLLLQGASLTKWESKTRLSSLNKILADCLPKKK